MRRAEGRENLSIPPRRSREADANAAECQSVRETNIFDPKDKKNPYVPIPMYMYAQRWKQNMTRDFGRVVIWLSLSGAPGNVPAGEEDGTSRERIRGSSLVLFF